MVTSHEILAATGLKSAQTLTRWANDGIIPKARIGTHPSGRGKIAFWPEWVLDFCREIVELRKSGYSVKEAAQMIRLEQAAQELEEKEKNHFFTDELEKRSVMLEGGKKISLLDVFTAVLFESSRGFITDPADRNKLIRMFKEQKCLDVALVAIESLYNPILYYDGNNVHIMPDFRLSHVFNQNTKEIKSGFVMGLLGPLKKAFGVLRKEFNVPDLAYPKPGFYVWEGKKLMEYGIHLVGESGFEVMYETARVVRRKNDQTDK